MNLNQGFACTELIAQLCLQDQSSTVVDLLALLKASGPQAHTDQSYLLGINTSNRTTTRRDHHSTYRSGGQERGLLHLTSISSLSSNHFSQLCDTSSRTHGLLNLLFGLAYPRHFPCHDQQLGNLVIA